MKSFKVILCLVSISMITVLTAFGSSIKQSSPSDAVRSINAAIQAGDVGAVVSMIDPLALKEPQKKAEIQRIIGMGITAAQSENGGVADVEIINEIIRGNSAIVKVIDHYKDGTQEEDEVTLVERDGKWYMTFEGM